MCQQCDRTATQTGVPAADVFHLFHAADVAEFSADPNGHAESDPEYDAKMDAFFDGVIENAQGWLDQ